MFWNWKKPVFHGTISPLLCVNGGVFFLFDRADCQGEVTIRLPKQRLIGKFLKHFLKNEKYFFVICKFKHPNYLSLWSLEMTCVSAIIWTQLPHAYYCKQQTSLPMITNHIWAIQPQTLTYQCQTPQLEMFLTAFIYQSYCSYHCYLFKPYTVKAQCNLSSSVEQRDNDPGLQWL